MPTPQKILNFQAFSRFATPSKQQKFIRYYDVLHLGLNAIIVEIDHEKQLLYVSDTANEVVFGDRAAIDCSKAIERDSIFYVDYDSDTTDNLRFIEFEDLMVGDMVILGIYESELKRSDSILVEDIQLSTQRLD